MHAKVYRLIVECALPSSASHLFYTNNENRYKKRRYYSELKYVNMLNIMIDRKTLGHLIVHDLKK